MNYQLLSDVLRSGREFSKFEEILPKPYGKNVFRPLLAEGLSDGAFELFVLTLARDLEAGLGGYRRLLVITPDERASSKLSDFLSTGGVTSAAYPARDYNFNNITASHDVEHERLKVLSSLLLTDAPMAVCATAEASLQMTIPEDVLDAHSVQIERGGEVELSNLARILSAAG